MVYVTLFLSNPCVFCKVQRKNLLLIKRHCCSDVSVLQDNPQSIKIPANNPCLCFLLCNLVSCGRRWERRMCLPLSTKLCNFGCQWYFQNIAEVLKCPFSGFLCKYTSIIASSVAKVSLNFLISDTVFTYWIEKSWLLRQLLLPLMKICNPGGTVQNLYY